MAHENIDLEKLIELVKGGATVRTENKPTIIAQVDPSAAQLDRLIGKLDSMVKVMETRVATDRETSLARSGADEVRSKRQLEVLATMQSLIRSGSVPKVQSMDLSPLKSVLSEIRTHSAAKAPVSYRFKVARTSQGFIDEIIATPQHASSH